MKIWINGIIREMTPEEEEAYKKEHENLPEYPESVEQEMKAEAYDILVGDVK